MNIDELIEVLSKNSVIQEAMYEAADAVVAQTLLDYRERQINDYENVKNGIKRNCYVLNDLEEDAFQISLRIQAVDMILRDFMVGHVEYDFEAVEWWDDKEGLS